MKAKKTKFTYPVSKTNVPVTQRMLFVVRDELKSEIKASGSRLESKLNSTLDQVASEIRNLSIEMRGMKTEIHSLNSQYHRMELLFEEQNARNAIVLDGLNSLFDRQERVEDKVDKLIK